MGSIFWTHSRPTAPLAPPRSEFSSPVASSGRESLNLAGLGVLLFDDDFQSRGSLRDALRAAGVMRITEASCSNASVTGGFGLPSQIDVIFSEVRLRNGNGLALLKAIRMGRIRSLKPDVCFILFTTQVDDALVRTAAGLHANGYVVKPAAPERVRQAIMRGRAKAITPDPEKYRSVDTAVAGNGFGIHAVQ
jgi:DNA-binding NarL/FixJ family response regulator